MAKNKPIGDGARVEGTAEVQCRDIKRQATAYEAVNLQGLADRGQRARSIPPAKMLCSREP